MGGTAWAGAVSDGFVLWEIGDLATGWRQKSVGQTKEKARRH